VKRILVALMLLCGFATQAPAQTVPPQQVPEIERIVRDYLIRNPEVLVEAMRALEKKKQDAADETVRMAVRERARDIFEDANSFVAGNPKGDVTVVEFFDYRCPYCKQAKPELDAAVKRDGKVRVVLKEFPVLGPDSMMASRAAVAVLRTQPARYLAFHDALMSSRGTLDEATVLRIARETGIDTTRMAKEMSDPKVEAILKANHELAQELLIEGTPAFIIGDRIYPGAMPTARFVEAIAQARQAGPIRP
jgi:protein-disulfide isomerase